MTVVARAAAKGEGDKIAYGQTAMFLGQDFIVTVRQGSTRAHSAATRTRARRLYSGGGRPAGAEPHGRDRGETFQTPRGTPWIASLRSQ